MKVQRRVLPDYFRGEKKKSNFLSLKKSKDGVEKKEKGGPAK